MELIHKESLELHHQYILLSFLDLLEVIQHVFRYLPALLLPEALTDNPLVVSEAVLAHPLEQKNTREGKFEEKQVLNSLLGEGASNFEESI